MEQMYQDYKDIAAFRIVYIREAHAADSDRPVNYAKEKDITQHRNYGERCTVAQLLVEEKKLNIPAIIENMGNEVDKAYHAAPTRAFLVRKDGKLGVAGGRGPRGFKPAFDEIGEWLKKYKETGREPGLPGQEPEKPEPTYENFSYGSHERSVLDFWQGQSETPAPLVVYIHGGGFTGGDKGGINAGVLQDLLDVGISVAAVNYRLMSHAPLPAAHLDSRRALQLLRSKAKEWNIDKTRVGAFGGSAGAQICMWLAFHDEMADLESSDPVEHESTRLTCVATSGGQTTMDRDWWMKWIPGYGEPHRDFFGTFGVQTQEKYIEKVVEVSALSLISKDDPPIFMSYGMSPDDPIPTDPQKARGWKVHHVIFGIKLKEKMDALGIEADLKYPGAQTTYTSIPHFFIEKLMEDS